MDIYLDFITKLKIVLKFIVHKYQQFLTTTYEFEIVNTSKGPVRGRKRINIHSENGKYYAFEGIPFAKPPLGKLRFRAPQPPEPWQEVLDCTNCKAKPMQYNYAFKLKEGSEDCLYLNVYARELHTAKPLPVMVWIYGGGFQIGEASRDMYAPDYFMQRDVILVTFNYRLGIFGFLCFDDPELNIPGNAGLKDQVLALRWVKDNIHNFNGDANNITVFGESAGGASTHFLMSIPRAKGLFHKAIVQSASMLCPWATTENHDWGYKTACIMGYNGDKSSKCVYDYLSRKSSHDLYLANYQLRTKERDMRNVLSFFIPVVEPYATDDCVISKPPKELLAEAWGNEIPLIIGGVLDEGFIFYNMARHVPYIINELGECLELMPDDLKHSRTQDELKQMAFRLKQLYFDGKDPNIRDNFYHFLELMGHRMIWHPIVRTLKARLKYASLAPRGVY